MVFDLSTSVNDRKYTEGEIKKAQDVLGSMMREKTAGLFAVIEKITDTRGRPLTIQGPSGVYEMSMAEVEMVLDKVKNGHRENRTTANDAFSQIIEKLPAEALGALLKEYIKTKKD